ncbi:hypothetical protein TcBrA4_0121100 [Trypanosoma cruzi]|nr:hypothetical protein TcBrA4_0121100 [Trypanosoma cruzi]
MCILAHGASDVRQCGGAVAAIYSIYRTRVVESKNETPIWILCIGGGGLVLGLATLGVRIMRFTRRAHHEDHPERGFSAELSTAMVVSFASGYGVPVSSTHCITGAVIAISIVDVGFWNVRWIIVAKLYAGWIADSCRLWLDLCTVFCTGNLRTKSGHLSDLGLFYFVAI